MPGPNQLSPGSGLMLARDVGLSNSPPLWTSGNQDLSLSSQQPPSLQMLLASLCPAQMGLCVLTGVSEGRAPLELAGLWKRSSEVAGAPASPAGGPGTAGCFVRLLLQGGDWGLRRWHGVLTGTMSRHAVPPHAGSPGPSLLFSGAPPPAFHTSPLSPPPSSSENGIENRHACDSAP